MGKRGRRKQQTERIQITLYTENKLDKEIYDYIMSGTSNSSAGRELLIDGWMKQEQFQGITIIKEDDPVMSIDNNKYNKDTNEIEITYDEVFEEIEEENSYDGFLI